jgi:phage/plasmid-like protein (TIGR03299 family)
MMAHKLDFSIGQAAFIAYQAPAWHGLGKVFNNHITIEQALKESGLDFHVDKLPNIHRFKVGKAIQEVVSKSSFFTIRRDTNAVLGDRLGRDYTVYQNTQALDVVDDLLKTKKVTIETVGAIDDGRKVFTCLKLNSSIIVDGKDEVFQYVLLANSHDGSLAITAMPTNVRVVCNNTLSAALSSAKSSYKIRHTANAADRVKQAFTIMGLLEDNSKANSAAYNAMKHNALTKQEFFDYIGNIFYSREEIGELQTGNKEAISTRKINTIGEVLQYAHTGIGQAEALGNNLNMWYAYNAVTGFLTSKKYSSASDRFDSLILGDSAKKILVAGELALQPHNIRPLSKTASTGLSLN